MKCIYCQNDTEVYNSRPNTKTPAVWRRRRCLFCVAQYTTIELPDYGGSFMVKGLSGTFYPFSRDKLYLSLHRALGHRNDATDAATALTSTIIGRVIRNNKTSGGQIAVSMLANTSYMTLKRFDVLAAHSYKAYHLSALKRAKNYSKVLQ